MRENLHVAMVVRLFSEGGGLELYAHKLVEGLVARGFRVTAVCEENKSAFTHPNLSFIHFTPPSPRLPKWKRMQHYYQAASEAVKQAGPFDLVHSQHLPMDGANVVTFHNHTVSRLSKVGQGWERILNNAKARLVNSYRLRDEYDRILCTNARCLMFSSKVCRDDFYDTYSSVNGMATTPSVVAYPGADLATGLNAASQNNSPRDDQKFAFLFVGRGFRKKGLDVLLDACRILLQQRRKYSLLIAGLREKPIDSLRLKLYGLNGTVDYLGFCKDMDAVYARAQAFVMPSRLEPFGMAPLQAMRWGIVPIVSRVSGVSELLSSEENALILENHLDSEELAGLMGKMMDEPSLLNHMRSQVRQLAAVTTWDKCVELTIEGYELCCESSQV